MTRPSDIRALIDAVIAGCPDGQDYAKWLRELSDRYLVLACGWKFAERTRWIKPGYAEVERYAILDGQEIGFVNYRNRPHPLANAQDALDSLPENYKRGRLQTGAAYKNGVYVNSNGYGIFRPTTSSGRPDFEGFADTPAKAIVLADLRRMEHESG